MSSSAYQQWLEQGSVEDNRRIQSWKDVVADISRFGGITRIAEVVSSRYRFTPRSRWQKPEGVRSAILCYHRIGTGGVPVYNGLPTPIFDEQIKYLKKHYRVVSLEQMLAELDCDRDPGPTVAITFDDGYVGTYTEAFPVLKKYDVPATVYLTVGCIETGELAWYDKIFLAFQVADGTVLTTEVGSKKLILVLGSPQTRLQSAVQLIRELRSLPNAPRVEFCRAFEKQVPLPSNEMTGRMLSWDQVRVMAKAKISFGGHTMSHPVVSRLTDNELLYELRDSTELAAQRIGAPVLDFAFPFGDPESCSSAAVSVLKNSGYRSAATTSDGINTKVANPFQLRRSGLIENRSVSFAALKLADLFLRGACSRVDTPALAASNRPARLDEVSTNA